MTETNEQRYYRFLKEIARYMPPAKLRRQAEKLYGISPEEAVGFAYDNVREAARLATKGRRAPRSKTK